MELDKRFALRKLLTNTQYHTSETSIPKEALTAEKEPALRPKLAQIAQQLVAAPDTLLIDRYEPAERKKDWVALQKKIVVDGGVVLAIDARSRPGHKILDHHMPHFYSVANHKGVSVRSLMTQEALEKALITNVAMHSTPYRSEIRRMLTMTGGLSSVTKYRTVTAKAIVQFFGAKSVLDPCAGWGGRMLGALAAGATYVGCEPDPNTAAGLRAILADVSGNAKIIESPAELVVAQQEKVDLVLTSPPYYNLELYTSGPQSVCAHPTWVDWSEKWLRPLILACLDRIHDGGTSCWSVKNFKSDKSYPLADFTKEVHKNAGWNLVKTVTMTGSGRMGAAKSSEEETFCFKRTTAFGATPSV
jgi:hypothetical protein